MEGFVRKAKVSTSCSLQDLACLACESGACEIDNCAELRRGRLRRLGIDSGALLWTPKARRALLGCGVWGEWCDECFDLDAQEEAWDKHYSLVVDLDNAFYYQDISFQEKRILQVYNKLLHSRVIEQLNNPFVPTRGVVLSVGKYMRFAGNIAPELPQCPSVPLPPPLPPVPPGELHFSSMMPQPPKPWQDKSEMEEEEQEVSGESDPEPEDDKMTRKERAAKKVADKTRRK